MEYARFRNRRLNVLVKTFGMANNKVWNISLIQLKPSLKLINISYYLLTQKTKLAFKKRKKSKFF